MVRFIRSPGRWSRYGWFGEPVFDTVSVTHAIEGVSAEASGGPLAVPGQIRELDAIVCEYGVDAVRNSFDQCFHEGSGSSHVGAFHHLRPPRTWKFGRRRRRERVYPRGCAP